MSRVIRYVLVYSTPLPCHIRVNVYKIQDMITYNEQNIIETFRLAQRTLYVWADYLLTLLQIARSPFVHIASNYSSSPRAEDRGFEPG